MSAGDPRTFLKRVRDRRILYVMATRQEYGARLRSLFSPLVTGVGPVEGAAALGATLGRLEILGNLPDLVVSLGSAGSRSLPQGEIFQVTSVSYRDMDASPLGFTKGATPFLDLPASIDLPFRIGGLAEATLSSGGNIVSGEAYEGLAADMVDMETYAHLRAAMMFDVPVIGLRGISDGVAELRRIEDWSHLLPLLDERLADAVGRLEAQLPVSRSN